MISKKEERIERKLKKGWRLYEKEINVTERYCSLYLILLISDRENEDI